jgi:signal transduction histidine kinase/DNA-binding response OmpR family regulator
MSDISNRRILVIDDNQAIHADFRKILAPEADSGDFQKLSGTLFGESPLQPAFAGFEISSAFQGEEGLQMVKQALAAGNPFCLAFIDVRMPPGWDGIETTAKIREVCPELQVVICTAYSDYDWSEIARRLGQTDSLLILKKPFDTVEVMQLAETLANKWTLARRAALRMADLDAMVSRRTQELCAANEELAREITERSRAQVFLSVLSSLGSLLSAANTIRQAGQILVDAADRLLGWDACRMDLYSQDSDLLTPVLTLDLVDGRRRQTIPNGPPQHPSPLARKAILEGGQLLAETGPEHDQSKKSIFGNIARPPASILCVPIRNGKSVTSLLSIIQHNPDAYKPQSLETLQTLAGHCEGAINRIQTAHALREAQEQLRQSQKLEAIGRLAGGIAHDFNNILTVICGNSELLRRQARGLPGDAGEYLDEISAAGCRAANLTRQLLAFSRKQMMQSQPADLNNVVLNLKKMLERIITEDIQVECHYAPGLPLVQADIGMLEQVLVNLAVNARDAMPHGGRLFIATESIALDAASAQSHPEGRPGQFVCVTVRDTGSGISPQNLPRIFDPFFTTKQVGKGTGLGLATAYGILKQHEGWIEVSSQVGVGSTFTFFLPALQSALQPANAQTPPLPLPHGRETVLLVEDEASVRSVTRRQLEHSGYHILEAGSGSEAMKLWETSSAEIDLLLTDLIMPGGISGRALAQNLRADKPSLKIIFHSGYGGADLGDDTTFLHQPDSAFLQKPCTPQELVFAVRRCLDGLPPAREHCHAAA